MNKHASNTNILVALYNLLERNSNIVPIVTDYISHNRINSEGDLLEYFVKDAFCDSYEVEKTNDKIDVYGKKFSYLGGKNHPPDFMIRHGDAVEVKKKQGKATGNLALNSSYPKRILKSNNKRLNNGAIIAEDDFGGWTTKDMLYAVGNITGEKIHRLWFVYGDCYCADEEIYERISKTMSEGINSIPGVEFSETKELGRINKIDPLKITNMRVRGMWDIVHPHRVFNYLVDEEEDDKAYVYLLMKEEKYDSINFKPNLQKFINNGRLKIKDCNVFEPSNPTKKIKAKFFSGVINDFSII